MNTLGNTVNDIHNPRSQVSGNESGKTACLVYNYSIPPKVHCSMKICSSQVPVMVEDEHSQKCAILLMIFTTPEAMQVSGNESIPPNP